jgi:simple sugar transport system ATP-binding protein
LDGTPADAPVAPEPIVELVGVTKRFPGVVANDRIDLAIRAGEVHVVLGENGAGKSTLVGLLSGLYHPDGGEIRIHGRATKISSPRRALDLGIGTVFQHVMLAPSLTIAENMALGAAWWRRPVARKLVATAEEIEVTIDPDARAGSLSLGELQQAEIVRALSRGSRVLLLDEATAMLTPNGAAELGALMRRLVRRGLAVVFITHKLKEAFAFGDRITVLRLGRKVGEIAPERLKAAGEAAIHAEIVQLMFGALRAGATDEPETAGVDRKAAPGGAPVILDVRDLHVPDPQTEVRGVSFCVAAGEIFGIAGIDGNGQKQLAEGLAGQRQSSGEILLEGAAIVHLDVGGRRRSGLRYVTDDRLSEGTIGSMAVATNLLLKQIGEPPFWRRGLVQPALIAAHATKLVQDFDVRTPSVETPIARLSGGNIQKAILARELSGQTKAVIYAKPTAGLDVQNIIAARRRIAAAAEAGIATILISTDLDELLELCDRIAVMARGMIVGVVPRGEAARRQVGELMVGLPG